MYIILWCLCPDDFGTYNYWPKLRNFRIFEKKNLVSMTRMIVLCMCMRFNDILYVVGSAKILNFFVSTYSVRF